MKSCGAVPLISPLLYRLAVRQIARRVSAGDVPATVGGGKPKLANAAESDGVRKAPAWPPNHWGVTSVPAAAIAPARVLLTMVKYANRTVWLGGTVMLYVHAILSPVRPTAVG